MWRIIPRLGTRIKRRGLPGQQHPEASSASYQHPVSHTISILAQENKDGGSCSLPAVLMQPRWWRLRIITSQGHSNQWAKHSSSQPRCTDGTKVCREENKHGDKRERRKLQIRRWNREEPRGWNKFRLRFLTHQSQILVRTQSCSQEVNAMLSPTSVLSNSHTKIKVKLEMSKVDYIFDLMSWCQIKAFSLHFQRFTGKCASVTTVILETLQINFVIISRFYWNK